MIVYVRSLPPVRNALPPTEIIFPVKYLIRSVPEPLTAPVQPPDQSTPEKRGAYLTNEAGCSDCHTPQDSHGMPMAGLDFAGGFILQGPFGRIASANITPDPSGIPYYDTGSIYGSNSYGFRPGAQAEPADALARVSRNERTKTSPISSPFCAR